MFRSEPAGGVRAVHIRSLSVNHPTISGLSVLLHHVHPFADRALQIKVSSEQDGDVSCTNVERDIGMREDVT